MRNTLHVHQRMSQRGINSKMLNVVLEYGRLEKNKHVLGRRDAIQLLEEFRAKEVVLKKIIDKGGLVVVSDGESLITTYKYDGRH